MHYAVKSWNELLSANTNKLKSANSLCHRAKPKHSLEADSTTGSWTPVWQPKASRVTRRRHIVVRDPLWRRGWNAYCSPCSACTQERRCDALWYTDTETDFFVLVLAHRKNLTLKRCHMKKGTGANIKCNSTQAMFTTNSWGALIGVNSNTGCDNISAFFGKGKWKAVKLLQAMEDTSEEWRVSKERVISIQWEL